ncbi:hypothetical protein KM043_006857 [Ampulex compressa]|nr:hypothetical protein KM043_006857 [Ampulex compressa]
MFHETLGSLVLASPADISPLIQPRQGWKCARMAATIATSLCRDVRASCSSPLNVYRAIWGAVDRSFLETYLEQCVPDARSTKEIALVREALGRFVRRICAQAGYAKRAEGCIVNNENIRTLGDV